ncbi:hypothetical protein [Helicobacter sp. L8]|uniref:hypothetical protein n=1 Tax=Helicobacter sp. L8 TaxID=2316078 RepID=UPI0013CE017C|nr:hypothetical protein [Helicobacter sp. L8]
MRGGRNPSAPTRVRKKFILSEAVLVRFKTRARQERLSQNALLQDALLQSLYMLASQNLHIYALVQANQAYLARLRSAHARF